MVGCGKIATVVDENISDVINPKHPRPEIRSGLLEARKSLQKESRLFQERTTKIADRYRCPRNDRYVPTYLCQMGLGKRHQGN
jgi:hypothetical protein